MAIATTNPRTGRVEKTFEYASAVEIERQLSLASSTFETYRVTDFVSRSRWMNAAADILDDECDATAALMTTEMGKTIASARAADDGRGNNQRNHRVEPPSRSHPLAGPETSVPPAPRCARSSSPPSTRAGDGVTRRGR